MSKKEKLIARFSTLPSDFHFEELVRLLQYFGYSQIKTGKTTGSRVKFINKNNISIRLHRPHPNGIMKIYQLKQVKKILNL